MRALAHTHKCDLHCYLWDEEWVTYSGDTEGFGQRHELDHVLQEGAHHRLPKVIHDIEVCSEQPAV